MKPVGDATAEDPAQRVPTVPTHTPSRSRTPSRRTPSRSPATLALAALAALALSGSAQAASMPSVNTGAAHQVSYASATLTGSVDPNGGDTSYYFQYGLTKGYGGQTLIGDAGAGTRSVGVAFAIGGLQPLSIYHYRLVAVNQAGATIGRDATLLTRKVPLSLQILASPNPVLFGGAITVQGTLSGTGNGGRVVVLQALEFGAAAFQNIVNPELTTAAGSFSFPILGVAQVTQFRVVSLTSPPVVSPVAVENVAVRVSSHVGRSGRHGFARIFGTVTPAEDGMRVGVLRVVHGRGVLACGTALRHRNALSSKFSCDVRVRRGVYRVLARVTGAAQISNYGQPLLIR